MVDPGEKQLITHPTGPPVPCFPITLGCIVLDCIVSGMDVVRNLLWTSEFAAS